MLWPVDPKPPRDVDEPEFVEGEPVLERLEITPLEAVLDGRRE